MIGHMIVGWAFAAFIITLKWQLFTCQCNIRGMRSIGERQENVNTYIYCDLYFSYSSCTNTLQYIDFNKCSINGSDCRPVFRYIQANYTYVALIYEDYHLLNRSTGQRNSQYHRLYISPTLIDDEGLWNCNVTVANRIYYSPTNATLTVYVRPNSNDITISRDKSYFVAKLPIEFTCLVPRVRPEVGIVWIVNSVIYSSDNINTTAVGNTFRVLSTIRLALEYISSINVNCQLQRNPGSSWRDSNTLQIRSIMPPPVAEYPQHAPILRPRIHDQLTLKCVISVISNITWTYGGFGMPSDIFHSPKLTKIKGSFTYDQTEALLSEIEWKQPSNGNTCGELDRYSGSYQCVGHLDEYEEHPVYSPHTIVQMQYAPQSTSAHNMQINTTVGQQVVITCPACASPPIHEYRWTHDGQHIKNGIMGSLGDTLIINQVQEDDFGVYRCQASNTQGYVYVETMLIRRYPIDEEVIDDSKGLPSDVIVVLVILSMLLLVLIVVTITGAVLYKRLQEKLKKDVKYLDNSTSSNQDLSNIYENRPQKNIEIENLKEQESKEENIETDRASLVTENSFDNASISSTNDDNIYEQLELARTGNNNLSYCDSVGNTEA